MAKSNRAHFGSRLGVIAVTVGSAVGLGNIWRFPYEAGSNGGGAFLLLNLLFVFIIGVPVMCAEFIVGRNSGSNVRKSYQKLADGKGWGLVGFISITASLLIMGFYCVVAGWTMEYVWISIRDIFSPPTATDLHTQFDNFATGNVRPVVWTLVFLFCNYLILVRGVEKGIEKASKVLMPVLFLILAAFCVNSLFMDKAAEGLDFLIKPDFSKITPKVVLNAMGQAFFSLSLGLGCLITYASYFKKETPLRSTSLLTASLDTFVAILAGVIIFPAVFTYGQHPAAGPKLVFEVLPAIFASMSGGAFWSVLFFLLLFVASLTSTLSLCETSIAYFVEDLKMNRRKATGLCIGLCVVLSTLCALSWGCMRDVRIFGLTFFNLFDFVSSNILLPVGGMITSIFVGWKLKRSVTEKELNVSTPVGRIVVPLLIFSMRYVAPAGILAVFLAGLGVF